MFSKPPRGGVGGLCPPKKFFPLRVGEYDYPPPTPETTEQTNAVTGRRTTKRCFRFQVKEDTENQSNDYEIVDFMMKKFKGVFGWS